MEDHPTICVCGYDRFRLADAQPRPECGQIKIPKPRAGIPRGLFQGYPSPTAVISFICGLITFGISTILTIVIVVMMASIAISAIIPVIAFLVSLLLI